MIKNCGLLSEYTRELALLSLAQEPAEEVGWGDTMVRLKRLASYLEAQGHELPFEVQIALGRGKASQGRRSTFQPTSKKPLFLR